MALSSLLPLHATPATLLACDLVPKLILQRLADGPSKGTAPDLVPANVAAAGFRAALGRMPSCSSHLKTSLPPASNKILNAQHTDERCPLCGLSWSPAHSDDRFHTCYECPALGPFFHLGDQRLADHLAHSGHNNWWNPAAQRKIPSHMRSTPRLEHEHTMFLLSVTPSAEVTSVIILTPPPAEPPPSDISPQSADNPRTSHITSGTHKAPPLPSANIPLDTLLTLYALFRDPDSPQAFNTATLAIFSADRIDLAKDSPAMVLPALLPRALFDLYELEGQACADPLALIPGLPPQHRRAHSWLRPTLGKNPAAQLRFLTDFPALIDDPADPKWHSTPWSYSVFVAFRAKDETVTQALLKNA